MPYSICPPLACGYLAARTLPDDLNVVAFWRTMVGVPAAMVWVPLVTAASFAWNRPAALAYVVISVLGIRLAYRFCKLSIAVFNSLMAPSIKAPLLALRTRLLASLTDA